MGPWVKWARLGPSNEHLSKSIADPMTLGHYIDSKPKVTYLWLFWLPHMLLCVQFYKSIPKSSTVRTYYLLEMHLLNNWQQIFV